MSRWERGQNSPTDLEAVATALQTTAGELLAGLAPMSQTARRRMGQHTDSQLDRVEQKLDALLTLLAEQSEP